MHLTDEQLHELDFGLFNLASTEKNENTKYSVAEAHMQHCPMCQTKLIHLKQFRKQLALDTEAALPTLQWEAIERELDADAENSKTQVKRLQHKVKRLQMAVLAAAASVLILVMYPKLINHSNNELEQTLAAVIIENHELQTNFAKFTQSDYRQIRAYKSAQLRLQEIDQEIQLAYLANLAIEQKIQLWNERKQLLIQPLNNAPKRSVFII